jgi:hypothetical protein
MRSVEELHLVLGLVENGLNDCEIARLTGIPRRTVLDWRHGRGRKRDVREPGSGTCPRCRWKCLPLAESQERGYAYLLGQYLGDGSISTHPKAVHRLRIFGDSRYVDIAAEITRAMQIVVPNNIVRSDRHRVHNLVVVSAYSRLWPCLFPQHGAGAKHTRPIALVDWQSAITARHPERFIRGLIHSDGCRSTNTIRGKNKVYRYPRYQFCNASDDIRRIFSDHLDLLGIPWRQMNARTISVARREAVARLDEFVGPKT